MAYEIVKVNENCCGWCFCRGTIEEKEEKYKKGAFLIKFNNESRYLVNWRLHNEQSPARIYVGEDGGEKKEYWLCGEHYSKKDWEKQPKTKLYW